VTLPVLLEFLQITVERLLPDIWHKWANCSKRQEFQVLWGHLGIFCKISSRLLSHCDSCNGKIGARPALLFVRRWFCCRHQVWVPPLHYYWW